MPAGGDGRGAAWQDGDERNGGEATRAFARSVPHSGQPGVSTGDTRPFHGDRAAATTTEDAPAHGAPDGPDRPDHPDQSDHPDSPHAESGGGTGAGGAATAGTGGDRTRVLRRPAPAPATEPGPPEEPSRPGRAGRAGTSGESDGPDEPGGRDAPDGPPAPAPRRRRRVRIRWIVALVLLLAVGTPPATWAWVWYTARMDDRPASDAILVLGASQYNGRPSPVFEARLSHAEELYREGVAPVVITVGGNQPSDHHTEGEAGRTWLVEQGVPAGDVVAVEEGNDTLQSIAAVSAVADANGWSSMVIVSDPWHSLRSRLMAEDRGLEAATSPARSGPAVIERETQLWYITRETAALWYYWLFGDSSDIEVDAV
ncbi:hypothetical protein GCM10027570_44140 [Streptomonospora sediminis]